MVYSGEISRFCASSIPRSKTPYLSFIYPSLHLQRGPLPRLHLEGQIQHTPDERNLPNGTPPPAQLPAEAVCSTLCHLSISSRSARLRSAIAASIACRKE